MPRLEGVEAIGMRNGSPDATPISRTRFTTQVVDLDRHLVLDVIEGRSRDVLDRRGCSSRRVRPVLRKAPFSLTECCG